MATKRRSKALSPRRHPTTKRTVKKPVTKKRIPRVAARTTLSTTYARPRSAGLPPVPAGYVGAVVDSLIRNDGARDVDVRGRSDGLFDVTRLA